MVEITESVTVAIARSGIKDYFELLVAPLLDPNATKGARAHAKAAAEELEDGIRRNSSYICKECFRQLPQSESDEKSKFVPKYALVNGYFRGNCPEQLQKLSLVDLSLISLINVVTKLAMLNQGCHYGSSATVFSVLNDVADLAEKLPRQAEIGSIVTIIRQETSRSPKSLRFNPKKVMDALTWLEENNDHYAGKVQLPIDRDGEVIIEWRNGGTDAELEMPHIGAVAEDYEGIRESDLELPAGDDGHAVNPGAPSSSTTDVLLFNSQSVDTRNQLAAIAHPNSSPLVVLVRHNGQYVPDYQTENFLEKAFPHLFPYGRGGGDTRDPKMFNVAKTVLFNGAYIQNMLLMGQARSFQQCPRFVFYAYTWTMRKKVGTIALLADSDNSADKIDFTVADAGELGLFLRVRP